jgi:hypothetical protein
MLFRSSAAATLANRSRLAGRAKRGLGVIGKSFMGMLLFAHAAVHGETG